MRPPQELWGLLASASQNPSGVPQRLLDEKAEELRKKKETQDRINVRCCLQLPTGSDTYLLSGRCKVSIFMQLNMLADVLEDVLAA